MHLLEPAPQIQTATAHLQTTRTVYFDGQGTQKLSCDKIPGGGGGGGGGGGITIWSITDVSVATLARSAALSTTD